MRRICILALWFVTMAALSGCSGKDMKETSRAAVTEVSRETETTVNEQETPSEAGSEEESKPSEEGGGDLTEERYRKAPDPVAGDGSRFLFIGNSHTYVNDLPGTFYELAGAGGHQVEVSDVTEGGYSLRQFSDPRDECGALVAEALDNESWDFVVLQDNTNAAVDAERSMFPYARTMHERIQAAGAQTAFFMTWAPKEGAGAFSREMVQDVLSDSYVEIAGELDGLLIPGGDLFSAALNQNPDLELWAEDGQHPSMEGTYLTACAAYALFFQETPEGNVFLGGLDGETAGALQEIAWSYMNGQE